MKMMSKTPALILSLAIAGCGGPAGPTDPAARFDASTDETAKASISRVQAGMTEFQRGQMAQDMATVSISAMMGESLEALKKGQRVEMGPAESLKPADGLTAAELHEKAEAIRLQVAEKKK